LIYWKERERSCWPLENVSMETINNALEQLAMLTEAAEALTAELAKLRETLSDDQWQAIENSPLDSLVAACCDIEYIVESNS